MKEKAIFFPGTSAHYLMQFVQYQYIHQNSVKGGHRAHLQVKMPIFVLFQVSSEPDEIWCNTQVIFRLFILYYSKLDE